MYRWDKKDTVEDHHGLDVGYLHRKGILTSGYHSISWSRGGNPTGNISYRGEEDAITLIYRIRIGGGEWESISRPGKWYRGFSP